MFQVVLPASMSQELMRQEAYRNGALLFELTTENGNRTHVGVLHFSAAEGTILLPPHVRRCLWGQDVSIFVVHGHLEFRGGFQGECQGDVKVCYKRLLDGTFARLQPIKQGFHEAVGDNTKEILEETLSRYSTLTEGDVIEISLLIDTLQKHDLKVRGKRSA